MRASTSSSSTSSVYTSGDDARRFISHEGDPSAEDVGTARLLGSHPSRDKSNGILDRLKIDK